MGMVAVNDLAVQVYAAAVSDMARNGFLDRPVTSEEIRSGTNGFFHGLP